MSFARIKLRIPLILTKKAEEKMSKNINKNEYKSYAERHAPKSPIVKDCALAFIVGGVICTLGEVLNKVYGNFLSKEDAGLLASVTLIFITALLTGIGVFDNIARFGGAGCLVPITGFANAVASQAVDSKSEGFVLGVGAKIFTVAGPVILYSSAAGALYGVIYWIYCLIAF